MAPEFNSTPLLLKSMVKFTFKFTFKFNLCVVANLFYNFDNFLPGPPAPWYVPNNGDCGSMQQEMSTTRPIYSPKARKIIMGDYHRH